MESEEWEDDNEGMMVMIIVIVIVIMNNTLFNLIYLFLPLTSNIYIYIYQILRYNI